MNRDRPPFRADHVGSLLRPGTLHQARADRAAGTITAEELRAVEDAAIRDAVKLQEDAGLASATDGEFRREQWHSDFLYAIPGIDKGALGMPLPVYRKDGQITWTPNATEITGKVVINDALADKPADMAVTVHMCRGNSGQCGFASTVEGNSLTIDEERAKLELIAQTAEEIWG